MASVTGVSRRASSVVVERKFDPKAMSALEIERLAVSSALQVARAEQAGCLDEAIFLHRLDAPVVAEYPALRENNAVRLVGYFDTVVVPAIP